MTMPRTLNTRAIVLIAAGTLLAICLLALRLGDTQGGAARAATPTPTAPVLAAQELVKAPAVPINAPSQFHSQVDDLRTVGGKLAEGVPLPAGVKLTVHWEAAAAQGGDSEAGMRNVIEYNAACKWYRAALQGATPEQLQVIETIADWPTFRGTVKANVARKVSDSLASGELTFVRQQEYVNCQDPRPGEVKQP